MDIIFNQRFDTRRNFQYVNDEPSVLHCHHYATLFTKLAIDKKDLQGPQLLSDSMEDSIFLVLKKYFIRNEITSTDLKIEAAEDYFSKMGMGKVSIQYDKNNGSARMTKSHIDEGWIKKWNRTDFPVNFMGCGFLAAVFSVVSGLPVRSFSVTENKSIVMGSPVSEFSITRKEKEEV